VAILATFLRDEKDVANVRRIGAYLRRHGFFVACVNPGFDTSQICDDNQLVEQLQCDLYVERRNSGYDFGSWAEGFFTLKARGELHSETTQELLIINDSCIFTDENSDLIQKARSIPVDVVGLTDSYQFLHHIQSNFMLVRRFQHPQHPGRADRPAANDCIEKGQWLAVAAFEEFFGGCRRGRLAAVPGLHDLAPGVVVHQKSAAADAGGLRFGERQHHLRGNRGVERGAASFEHHERRPRGMRIGGGSHHVATTHQRSRGLSAAGLGLRGRRLCKRSARDEADDRDGKRADELAATHPPTHILHAACRWLAANPIQPGHAIASRDWWSWHASGCQGIPRTADGCHGLPWS
jgi:hypothetical protein